MNDSDKSRTSPRVNDRQEAADSFVSDDVAAPGQADSGRAPGEEDAEVLQLRQDLQAARKRVDDLARAVQSLTQDREEFKLRLSRERDRMLEVEKGNVAVGLLEAIDDLDLCLNASAEEQSPLATGVRLIRDNLVSKAQASGVERLSLMGTVFDPNVAEAADMELTPDLDQDQRVIAELRAGYRLKGRVIRPGRVKVAKYVTPASA